MTGRHRVAFVGGGVMAEAMIAGMIRGGIDADIAAIDVVEARLQELKERYGVTTLRSILQPFPSPNVLIVSVKPQQFADVIPEMKAKLTCSQTVVSIMAGITIAEIRSALGHDAVVRVMPNTPAQIGVGAAAWTATESVPESAKKFVGDMLDCIGIHVYFNDEKLVDVATALSASGPAYVFVFLEALADAAVQLGMPAVDARRLAVATVKGSAELASERDEHFAELRNKVTSPGGTTAAALKALEEGGFRNTTMNAVIEAYRRGVALSRLD